MGDSALTEREEGSGRWQLLKRWLCLDLFISGARVWQWGLHYAQDVLWNPQRSPRGEQVEIPGSLGRGLVPQTGARLPGHWTPSWLQHTQATLSNAEVAPSPYQLTETKPPGSAPHNLLTTQQVYWHIHQFMGGQAWRF